MAPQNIQELVCKQRGGLRCDRNGARQTQSDVIERDKHGEWSRVEHQSVHSLKPPNDAGNAFGLARGIHTLAHKHTENVDNSPQTNDAEDIESYMVLVSLAI